jgi:hypothetical protein
VTKHVQSEHTRKHRYLHHFENHTPWLISFAPSGALSV